MSRRYLLFMLCPMLLVSCAENPLTAVDAQSPSDPPGEHTFMEIDDTLEVGGRDIDYDALIRVYNTLSQTRHEIPRMDLLLATLMDKRNDNPRIDQMVLIFTAKALGGSKHPIPHVYPLFERLLSKDDRLSEWVLAFVAEAIENYVVDIQGGEKLVDLLEEKLAMVRSGPPKEFFGSHFY